MKASEIFSKRKFYRAWFRRRADGSFEITLFIRNYVKSAKLIVKKIRFNPDDIIYDEEVSIE